MTLAEALETYGYAAILVGTFLEGETILVLGGFAAQVGHLSLPLVMLCAFIGSLFGDQLWFFVGRKGGAALLKRRPAWHAMFARVNRMLERHQVLFILGFRFLYGLRTVAPFAIGMSNVRTSTYAVLNVIGAAVWAVAVGALGYLFGNALQLALGRVKQYEHYVLGAIVFAGLCLWFWRWRRARLAAAQLLLTGVDPLAPGVGAGTAGDAPAPVPAPAGADAAPVAPPRSIPIPPAAEVHDERTG